MDLRDRIADAFTNYLKAHSFCERSYSIVEQHFGNSILCARSNDFEIRFVTDRGDLFIDVAASSDPNNWYSLDALLEILWYGWGVLGGISDKEIATILAKEHRNLSTLLDTQNLADTGEKIICTGKTS